MKLPVPIVASIALMLLTLTGCQAAVPGPGEAAIVRVPGDVPTLTEAATTVAENGLILIAPGTYTETLEITTPGVTVRGLERSEVIIDGEGIRSNGIIASAPGVTVENLTVYDHLLNGILITGVTDESGHGIGAGSGGYEQLDPETFPPVAGFAVRSTTAAGNGLYGIYAFNRTDGVIEGNYASGSSDSGIYVGQCRDCNILVTGNVAERNAIGLEMANASGTVVVGNRFAANRVGASIQSNYQEAFVPQRDARIVGNVFDGNNETRSPEVAEGGFGIGIGLAGVQGSEISRNRITGNSELGIAISPSSDIPSEDNTATGNLLGDNGIDVAVWTTAQTDTGPQCLAVADVRTVPSPLPASLTCAGTERLHGLPAPEFPVSPAGISFLEVPKPGALAGLSFDDPEGGFGPATGVTLPDVAAIAVPGAALLAELSQISR